MRQIVTTLSLSLGLVASLLGGAAASAAPPDAGTVIVQLDNPSQGEQNMTPNWISGWAIDTAAMPGPGITGVAVYIDGDATSGHWLGQAKYGGDRNDVALQYNNSSYRYSGFTFDLTGLPVAPGSSHSFTVIASSAANGTATATASGVTLAPQWNNGYGYNMQGYGMQGAPLPSSQAYGQSGMSGNQAPYAQSYGVSASDQNGLPIIGNDPYGAPIQPVYTPTYSGNYYGNGSGYNGSGNGYNGYGYGMNPYYGGSYGYNGYRNGYSGYGNGYYGGMYGSYFPGSLYGSGYNGYYGSYPGNVPYQYR